MSVTATLTPAEVIDEILSPETIISDAPQKFPEAASLTDYFRQGDLNIFPLDEIPDDAKQIEAKKMNPQLAPGTTKGSRHVLDSLEGVTLYEREYGDALQGPLLKCEQERVITHPEHGDVILGPGCYEITYQRMKAEELRRVMD